MYRKTNHFYVGAHWNDASYEKSKRFTKFCKLQMFLIFFIHSDYSPIIVFKLFKENSEYLPYYLFPYSTTSVIEKTYAQKIPQLTLGMHQSSRSSSYQEKLLAFLRSAENKELQQHLHT